MQETSSIQNQKLNTILLLIVLFVFLIAAYTVIRFDARRIDGDTALLIISSKDLMQSGSLTSGKSYRFGFNYPVINSILSLMTGMSIYSLVTFIKPFWIILLPPIAYICYRQLFIKKFYAILAVFFLFIQPEFLFVVLRGSHEIITWFLVFFIVFILTKSYLKVGQPKVFLKYILLFYMAVFGLITTSYFFASTFIFGLVIAFVLGTILRYFSPIKGIHPGSEIYNRLIITTISCAILVFIFIFYIYPPAQSALYDLKTFIDKISAMLFGFELQTNPYEAYIPQLWINPFIYPILTLSNWLLILISFISSIMIGYRRVINRKAIYQPFFLFWLLYCAFAFQMFLSVVADFSGGLSSNLQLRLFPPLVITGVPLTAYFLMEIGKRFSTQKLPIRFLKYAISTILIGWLVTAAILKSTTEPLVSNKWSFSTISEFVGLEWMSQFIIYGPVWISPDERLREISRIISYDSNNEFSYDLYYLSPSTRYVFMSDVNSMLAQRLKLALPEVDKANLIYSNGNSSIFKYKTKTLFEK